MTLMQRIYTDFSEFSLSVKIRLIRIIHVPSCNKKLLRVTILPDLCQADSIQSKIS